MRLILSSLLALCFWVMPALGQSPSPTIQTILQIEDDWLKAEPHTDPVVLERVLADDFVNLGPSGLAPGKSNFSRTSRLMPARPRRTWWRLPTCAFTCWATQPSPPT